MSSSTPPLFCPPLQLRRLCCCPSCIDVPIFVLASITILLAAAVCVVPLMLLPMPPPPLIAFLVGTMRLPLRIPPMPPSPPHLRRVLRQVLRRVLRRFNQSASVFCRSNSYSRCCCRCHHRPHRSFTRLWPRRMLLLAPAAYDSTAITPSRFCFDEGLKRCLVPLRCSFCLPLCCHHCCVADVAASTAVFCCLLCFALCCCFATSCSCCIFLLRCCECNCAFILQFSALHCLLYCQSHCTTHRAPLYAKCVVFLSIAQRRKRPC